MDLYAQNILDRYKNPFFKDKSIVPTLTHREANHSCGDEVEVDLTLKDGKISAYAFRGQGCAISMASADILGDLMLSEGADSVLAISKETLFEALGIEISLRRSKCALLGLLAAHNALLTHAARPPRSWTDYHLHP